MASIAKAVAQIKSEPRGPINVSIAEAVCRRLGLRWANTPLTPPVTLALLAQQVLRGNVSNPELIRAEGLNVTAAAYCTAKGRLPLEAVKELSRDVCNAAQQAAGKQEENLWRGHKTWHLDGSSVSMPDTPELQEHFGQPSEQKPGCGFPVAHLLCLFGAVTGLILDMIVSPFRTGDLTKTPEIHAALKADDVVIADTAFSSYYHIAALSGRGVFGVFPSHQMRVVSFKPHRAYNKGKKGEPHGRPTSRWVKRLGKDDQVVEYFKPKARPRYLSAEEYLEVAPSVQVREIRRTIRRKGFKDRILVVATTLLDAEKYPADDIVALTKERWNVELNLRHLKTTMGMEILRCQSVDAVQKELWAYVLIYNLARVVMLEAAQCQDVPLDRISFADALYWLRYARPGDGLPALIVNVERPDRIEPRAVKRRPKEYDRLTKPRAIMRKLVPRKK
jgi:hypothetical protein